MQQNNKSQSKPPGAKLPRAVIFDWDNTLVDTWPLIHSAINATMEKMSKELWSLDRVKNDIHASMRESFPALFGEKWKEAGEIYKAAYRAQHLDKLIFLPKALELIKALEEKNILLIIISNKMGDTLRIEADNLKINNRFYSFIGSTDAEFDKPHCAPVELALKGSGIDPKKDLIWFVGDTIADIECAINSNCQPILYGEGRNVPKDLIAKKSQEKEKPMLCFKSHQEILNYLNSL
jgi:phosphoglycolate phosphatase